MSTPSAVTPEHCSDCGARLPPGTPQGFCPRCVLAEMESDLNADPRELFDALPLRLVGDYELLQIVGRGGMGIVYRARHAATGTECALKMIAAGELASPTVRRRFLQEAGAASALQHPNIVPIHATGSHEGMPYYVMDYVPGRTLADAVREKPMPAHAAAACMAKVAAAIQHAHESGVLHRDLKPSNILLDKIDEPKVTDFGLARHLGTDSSLTGSQQILGSPAYMSPEQAAGGSGVAAPGVDIYSLGAVLYHLLTGHPPFQGESAQNILRQVTDNDPVAPRRLSPGIPRELETITLKCLEKNPARRYAAARELEEELLRWLRGEPVLARPIGMAGRGWRWVRRNPAVAGLTALLLAGAVTGVGFILHSNHQLRQSDAEKSTVLTEKEATLAESLLWQAEFQRMSGRQGQREGSLSAIREALRLPLSPEQRLRARNAAIAAAAQPDAKFVVDPHMPLTSDPSLFLTDPACRHYAVATAGGKVRITEAATGALVTEFDLGPQRINALLRWSDDSQFIAYRFDDTRLGLLHWKVGRMVWTSEVWPAAGRSTPNQVAFHPLPGPGETRPHRVVHPEKDGSIVFREAVTGIVYRRIPASPSGPSEWRALAWDPAGKLLAAASGTTPEIVIWNMNVNPPVIERKLQCRSNVESLDWEARENWLLAGDKEGRLTVWNPQTGIAQPPFEGHTQPVISSASGRENYRHASAAGDGTVRLWDRMANRPVLTLPGNASRIYLTNNGNRVGPVIQDGEAGWYDLQWSSCLVTLNPAENPDGGRSTAFCRSNTFVASLTGRGAVVWKANPVNGHHLIIPHEHPASLTWFPDSHWLVTAGPDGVHTHALRPSNKSNLAAPNLIASARLLECPAADVCMDAAGTVMAVVRSDTGVLELYGVDSTVARLTFKQGAVPVMKSRITGIPAAPGTRCALSPDGKWLAAGSPAGSDARIYEVATGALVAEPKAVREGRNWFPVFSEDNAFLMFSGRTAHLMKPGDWTWCAPVPVPPNQGGGRGAAFLPVKSGLAAMAVVGADEEIHVFRTGDPGKKLAVLRSPQGGTIGSLYANVGGVLCAAAPRGELQLWPLFWVQAQLTPLGLAWEAP